VEYASRAMTRWDPGPVTIGQQSEPPTSGRRLRRDALTNQERVLAAAVTVMLREGRSVPMAAIAAEAGVGVATLYRRYATREALLAALTERSFRMVLAVADEAAAQDGSALAALDWFLERTIEHRTELVLPLHGGPSELPPGTRAVQAEVHLAIARLLERGRVEGTIRSDVTTTDVVIFGAMLAQPLSNTSGWDALARRQKQLFLRSVFTPHAGDGPSTGGPRS
jgi:AcrR family transcriptional regulator